MATLEEEISDLKAKIEKYEVKLDAATTEAGEERYANLITESRKTLNILLQQQPQGKVIITSRLPIQHRCFEMNPISGSPLISPSRSLLSVT